MDLLIVQVLLMKLHLSTLLKCVGTNSCNNKEITLRYLIESQTL